MISNPIVDSSGNKRWENSAGNLHRLDGPAIECADGNKEWWVKGKEMTEEEFNSRIKTSSQEVYVSPFTGKLV